MIQNGEIIDFSSGISDFKINQYIISSSSIGCNFNLISKKNIEEETNKNITLNFIEKENSNNKIKAECILSNKTENKIPCYLGEEVNKNFILDSYIGLQEKNIFLITQENKVNNLLLTCLKEKEKKDNKVITIVVVVIILIFIAVIVLLVFIRKKQAPQEPDIKNIQPEKDDFFFYYDNNDIRSMSSRSNSDKDSSLSSNYKNKKK